MRSKGRRSDAKAALVTIAAAALLLAGAGFVLSSTGEPAAFMAVAEVEGDPVTVSELNHFAGEHRATVIERFTRENGASVDADFWKREIAGESPIEALRNLALKDAVQMKVELQLARQKDIVESVSYESFMEQMVQENKRRAAVAARGEPIYGPLRFEASTFVDFYRSKINTLLREELAASELMADDAKLKRYYDEQLPELMPVEDRIVYDRYTLSYLRDGERDEAVREEAGRLAEKLRVQLLSRADQEQRQEEHVTVHTEKGLVLDSANASRMYKSENALYTALHESATQAGAVIVVEDPAAASYVVVQVRSREPGERAAFEEVRDQVRKVYLEQAFEAYIAELMAKADIVLLPELQDQTMGMTS